MMRPGVRPTVGFLIPEPLAALTAFRLLKAGIAVERVGRTGRGQERLCVATEDAARAREVIEAGGQ